MRMILIYTDNPTPTMKQVYYYITYIINIYIYICIYSI